MEEYETIVSESEELLGDYSTQVLSSEFETDLSSVSDPDGSIDYSFDFMAVEILLCMLAFALLLFGKNDK